MSINKLDGILRANNAATYCSFEYPWFHSIITQIRAEESCYLVVPQVFGDLCELCFWLEDEFQKASELGRVLVLNGPVGELVPDIVEKLVEGFSSTNRSGSVPWFEELLTAYRDENPPAIPPRTFLVVLQDASEWHWLEELSKSQRRFGVTAATCIVVTNFAPTMGTNIVRYSPPHLFANLERLPDPDHDNSFWSSILNSFIAVWESAGIPEVATHLNEELSASLGTWSEANYGMRRDEVLRKYADSAMSMLTPSEIDRLKTWALPVPNTEVEPTALINPTDVKLWHSGALQYQDGIFDITPVAARRLMIVSNALTEDERMSLVRRRLNNASLARWISGWATTVEENLRQVILSCGDNEFFKYLQAASPFNNYYNSRYDELLRYNKNRELGSNQPCIEMADATDMIAFISKQIKFKKWQQDLETWRRARNSVIHERLVSPQVIKSISRMVNLMRKDGFV
jgi:hypothetical protein